MWYSHVLTSYDCSRGVTVQHSTAQYCTQDYGKQNEDQDHDQHRHLVSSRLVRAEQSRAEKGANEKSARLNYDWPWRTVQSCSTFSYRVQYVLPVYRIQCGTIHLERVISLITSNIISLASLLSRAHPSLTWMNRLPREYFSLTTELVSSIRF